MEISNFFKNLKIHFLLLSSSFRRFLFSNPGFKFFPFTNNLYATAVLFAVSTIVYLNTLSHETAYDDDQVIRKNDFVLRGIKGIPDIISKDSHYSFYKNSGIENILPGGRYRPLSIISFSIEQELVGTWHDKVPRQFIWDVNGNGLADPDEDKISDRILNEDDFFARGTGLRHFINIFLYAVLVSVLYLLFGRFLKILQIDLLFVALFLFAVHPIHTEVVANIKSRDEILSLLFISLSVIFFMRYYQNDKKFDLIAFGAMLFLALLSKEFAVLTPLICIVSVYISNVKKIKLDFIKVIVSFFVLFCSILLPYLFHNSLFYALLLASIPLLFLRFLLNEKFYSFLLIVASVFSMYFVLRFHATASAGNSQIFDNNVISNPYLTFSAEEKIATKIYVLLKYIMLLFLPVGLSCDYSFQSISPHNFNSPLVYISLMVCFLLIIASIYSFIRQKRVLLPLLIFLFFLLPVSNIFIEIGAPMGERLIFHSSLGFVLLLVFPFNRIILNENKSFLWKKIIMFGFLGLGIFYVVTTILRNPDWKNNDTLFAADLKKFPNNISLISGVASGLGNKAANENNSIIKKKYVTESISLVDKGLRVCGTYMPLYHTLALDFFIIEEYEKSASACRAGLKVRDEDPALKSILSSISKKFIDSGIKQFNKKQYDIALQYFDKALKADSMNSDAWYNKAYTFKAKSDTVSAIRTLERGLKKKPRKEMEDLLKKMKRK